MGTVLYVTAEVLRIVGILIQPYMPGSAAKLLDVLSIKDRQFSDLPKRLAGGVALPAPTPIFPRFVEEGEILAKA
jgi:methionyl-tRNA synthetase